MFQLNTMFSGFIRHFLFPKYLGLQFIRIYIQFINSYALLKITFIFTITLSCYICFSIPKKCIYVILSHNFLVWLILPPFKIIFTAQLEKSHVAQNIAHTKFPDPLCASGCPQCSHMLRMAICAVVCHLSPKAISLLVITAQTFGGNTICKQGENVLEIQRLNP